MFALASRIDSKESHKYINTPRVFVEIHSNQASIAI